MPKELLTHLDANGNKITELGTPTAATDAATKQYVDDNSTEITQQAAAPSSPTTGDLWLDTDEGSGVGLSSIIAYAEVTTAQTLTAAADLTGLSVTVTVPAGRRLKITGSVLFENANATARRVFTTINEDASVLSYATGNINATGNDNRFQTVQAEAIISPAAGSHTYKLRGSATGFNVIANSINDGANKSFILVEDITGTLWPVGSTINNSNIGADAIAQVNLQNGAVGTAEILDSAVTQAKIADNAITQSKMADNSVGTAEIVNGNVTNAKLESSVQTILSRAVESAQTNLQIQSNTIVASPDGNGVITVFYAAPFPVAPQAVVLTNGEDGQGVIILSMLARTTDWFTFRVRDHAGGIIGGGLFRVNWFASIV